LAVAPGLHELDPQEFLQSKTQQSYYDKWLQLSHKNREQQTKVTSAHTTTMVENSSDEKLPTPPPEPPSPQVYHNQTLDPKKNNLVLDSEFNSIHFGVEINKSLKFLGPKICDKFENSY